ncbi:MAG TPA: hypothetical protein VK487_09075 [Candidatus Bathyarchaeia archaeon]|nr:hypothetical protein [Candidatus Bathyarchaeia archaeon]
MPNSAASVEMGLDMKRRECCPRCGSPKVHWVGGNPLLWSIWECPICGYKGALVIEEGELAALLRKEYLRKTGKEVDS